MPHNRKRAKEHGYRQGKGLWIDLCTDNLDQEGHIKDYSSSDCWMRTSVYIQKYAPYRPGDILYVRETWCYDPDLQEYYYRSNRNSEAAAPYGLKWHPSIHMQKEAARIWLKVTDVRVEQLQDITEAGAEKEGAKAYGLQNCSGTSARIAFAEIWDKTVKQKEYEWTSNQWVWVIEFERCEKPDNS